MARLAKIKKIIFVLYLAAIHTLAGFFIYEKFSQLNVVESHLPEIAPIVENTPFPTPLPIPPSLVNAQNFNQPANADTSYLGGSELMIPVKGVKRQELQDTFADARSEDRVHNAIDIPAPEGTPVVAAADGEIAKLHDSEKGGIAIYQYSRDRRTVYYYAHLQSRAEGLKEGDFVNRGTVIGYVGDTGNAGEGNYHLHFSIIILGELNRFWEGTNINPYPLLQDAIEAQ